MKPLKILNLNIWNYNKWEERKPKIISFIRKHNPDIIILQEVRDDLQFNKKGNNQAEQLNSILKYPYLVFYPVENKRKERPEKYKLPCVEGSTVLSRFPIIKTDEKKLKKHPEDKYGCGNLFVKLKNGNETIDLVAVHFSPNDLFSKLHLIETLEQVKKKKIRPIIVGDFNIHEQGVFNELTEDYKSSMKFKKYTSYPLANWTLDYILIPREFSFKSLKCEGNISDHKALIAEIDISKI